MIPYPHQEELAPIALDILRQHAIVYLAMEERTGKTLISLLVAEQSAAKSILIITKKKALPDWIDVLRKWKHTKRFTPINYHQAHKLAKIDYDLIILDESHNYISSYPKPGLIWKQLKPMLAKKPIIYISATPYAQGPQLLYHQFALSSWSPWRNYSTFYSWFKTYGKPYTITVHDIEVPQYDRCHEELVLEPIDHLFIRKTRKKLGFAHEPEDKLHYIELNKKTKEIYNTIIIDEMIELPECLLICDTKSKLRFSLHQLEGGTMKMDDFYYVLNNTEKIDYILEHFGDTKDLVIMYHYKAELIKLSAVFKKARILQATSYAEGVDLHKYKNLVIYSQDFSTARHTQRRARQCNKNRDQAITVHYLLVKKGLSEQVYKTVSVNKRNFVDSVYYKETL